MIFDATFRFDFCMESGPEIPNDLICFHDDPTPVVSSFSLSVTTSFLTL